MNIDVTEKDVTIPLEELSNEELARTRHSITNKLATAHFI